MARRHWLFRRASTAAKPGLRLLAAGFAVMAAGAAGPQAQWLALCSKCLSPTVVEKSGIGTAHAQATARMTRAGAEDWCADWYPDQKPAACAAEALREPDAQKTYHASADCMAGTITAVDGVTYRLAGIWTAGIGRGRTKWRDPQGDVLGDDNASGGLGIAQQWEVLCPGPPPRPTRAAAGKPGLPTGSGRPAGAAPGGADSAGGFAVGETIEARYGSGWVRGHIARIYRHEGAGGNGIAYDVRLENGKRGIVPASMLRAASP